MSDLAVAVAVVAGAVVAIVTAAFMPVVIWWSERRGILDEPGLRSSHERPTPRLGGVAVGVGLLVGYAVVVGLADDRGPLGIIVLAALVVGVVGLADDLLRGSPVSARLAGQVVGASATVGLWVAGEESWALAALATLATVVVVNVFNFMDGANGVAGCTAIVVGADLVLVGLVDEKEVLLFAGLLLVGAAVGFLPFNVPRARVFLGDVGSYGLGAWIAASVTVGLVADLPWESVGAVLLPYLADTGMTLARRIGRGDDWRASHHEHFYQQLLEHGWSHGQVALVVAAAAALCGGLGLVSLSDDVAARVAADVALVAVVAAYLMLPGLVVRRQTASRPVLSPDPAGE